MMNNGDIMLLHGPTGYPTDEEYTGRWRDEDAEMGNSLLLFRREKSVVIFLHSSLLDRPVVNNRHHHKRLVGDAHDIADRRRDVGESFGHA